MTVVESQKRRLKVGTGCMSSARRMLGVAITVGAVLASSTIASAAYLHPAPPNDSFGSDGTSVGSFEGVGALGLNQVGNRLYVQSNSAHAIHGFEVPSVGTHVPVGGDFPLNMTETAFGGFAVDGLSGNIYPLTGGNLFGFDSTAAELPGFPVEGFTSGCGDAVDSAGHIWVVDAFTEKIKEFNSLGQPLRTLSVPGVYPCRLAIDGGNDDLYVTRNYIGGALRYTAASNYVSRSKVGTGEVQAIAVDGTSHTIYMVYSSFVRAFTPTGGLLEEFATGIGGANFRGIAIDEATGTIYLADGGSGKVLIVPSVIVPDAVTGGAPSVTQTSATVAGHVDPAGGGQVTECYFEYGETASYGQAPIPCVPGTPISASEDVTAELLGLESGRTFHYRLVVANSNGKNYGDDRTVTTARAPTIEAIFSSGVTATTADLRAKINPQGLDTTYRFEYGTTDAYGTSVPVPDESIGSTQTAQSVSAHLTGLRGVTYHFRLIASNTAGTVVTPDQTFNFLPQPCPNAAVRQQTGSEYLPDCRAYELVSPGNAGNVLFFPDGGQPAPYASSPPRFAYTGALGGITGTDPINSLSLDTYVATRTDVGWKTNHTGLEGSEALANAGVVGDLGLDRFIDFRFNFQIGPLQPPHRAPYVFDSEGNALGRWPATLPIIPDGEEVKGAFQPSPDFSHLAFSSRNIPFAPGSRLTVPGSAYDYDTATGTTTIISKTASGQDIAQESSNSAMTGEFIGFPGVSLEEEVGLPTPIYPGVSTDGSHILMSMSSALYNGFSPPPPVRLYMRVDGAITYEVSKEHVVDYVGMTADGSKVFFTSDEKLTSDDHDTSVDLFMWTELGDELIRISSGSGGSGDSDACSASWIDQCGVLPVDGETRTDNSLASESGDIYFYSPEKLDGSKGIAGLQNLYVYHDGSTQFVHDFAEPGPSGTANGPVTRIQVSPDNSHMAFVTTNRVTSYDNASIAEMYSYDPSGGETICVSCPPNGDPPIAGGVRASRQGLFMSDDGRTFFYTPEALVLRDTNNLSDVYEFVENRAQLITQGTGAQDTQTTPNQTRPAGLAGVSADGRDVYFSTFDTIVGQDENGQFLKFYDARTGGGFPFIPPPPPCEAADECHGPGSTAPSPPRIASEGRLGAGGNAANAAARRKAHKQGKRKAQKKRKRRLHAAHGKGARR